MEKLIFFDVKTSYFKVSQRSQIEKYMSLYFKIGKEVKKGKKQFQDYESKKNNEKVMKKAKELLVFKR